MPKRKDLFSSLYRWAHQQGENFTTEAFVFLLNRLLDFEPVIARSLLNWLCFGDSASAFFGDSNPPDIAPWCGSEHGTPDIRITAPDIFVLVEVKKGSDLYPGQLRNYRNILNEERPSAANKALVLLTAFDATFDQDEAPDVWKRWGDVEQWLGEHSASVPVAEFLIDQFRLFLRGEGMAFNRVEWQYVEGVKSLVSLTDMLQQACNNAKVPITRSGGSSNDRGSSIGGGFWVGIYMSKPEELVFQCNKQDVSVTKCLEEQGWKRLDNGIWAAIYDLLDESNHFFSLERQSQLNALTDFVKKAHAEGTKCLPPGAGPAIPL